MRQEGSLYKSRWDGSTWAMIALAAACCVLPYFFNYDGIWPFIICGLMLIFVIVVMKSVYYRIDGDNLIVYQFFIPSTYPIGKISDISSVRTYLSAPATSLTHRIAIRFSDRKILKGIMPLVISPAKQSEFIAQLMEINPDIKVSIR